MQCLIPDRGVSLLITQNNSITAKRRKSTVAHAMPHPWQRCFFTDHPKQFMHSEEEKKYCNPCHASSLTEERCLRQWRDSSSRQALPESSGTYPVRQTSGRRCTSSWWGRSHPGCWGTDRTGGTHPEWCPEQHRVWHTVNGWCGQQESRTSCAMRTEVPQRHYLNCLLLALPLNTTSEH